MAVTNQTSAAAEGPVLKHHDVTIDRKDNDDKEVVTLIRRRSSDSSSGGSSIASSVTKKDGYDNDAAIRKQHIKNKKKEDFNAKEFLDKRVMTSTQELFNSITMLPGIVYCLYFILAGCWVVPHGDENESDQQQINNHTESSWTAALLGGSEHLWIENFGCLNNNNNNLFFNNMTALPPLPILVGVIGILAHSPISMLYHYKCATSLPPSQRITHWSRRLDNAFIHFASCCAAYATSGRLDFFVLNVIFNVECALRQFEEEVKPPRNLGRIGMSIGLYLMPVIVRGHWGLMAQFLIMFGMCGWLFVKYPFGGWSHGIFHIVLSFLPCLVLKETMQLESTQIQIGLAMKCAGM